MRRIRRALTAKEQGFTLIELLVVIIIIGILAAVAIPVFLNQRKKGVDASMKSDAKNAATAAESYIADNPDSNFTMKRVYLDVNGFKNSEGNIISVGGTVNAGYFICVTNPGSSAGTGTNAFVVYNSNTGGLRQGFGTCA